MKNITDTERVNYLIDLFENCSCAEIIYNDDPDRTEHIGWTIRVHGCEVSEVTAETLRHCLDKEIVAAQNSEWPKPNRKRLVLIGCIPTDETLNDDCPNQHLIHPDSAGENAIPVYALKQREAGNALQARTMKDITTERVKQVQCSCPAAQDFGHEPGCITLEREKAIREKIEAAWQDVRERIISFDSFSKAMRPHFETFQTRITKMTEEQSRLIEIYMEAASLLGLTGESIYPDSLIPALKAQMEADRERGILLREIYEDAENVLDEEHIKKLMALLG